MSEQRAWVQWLRTSPSELINVTSLPTTSALSLRAIVEWGDDPMRRRVASSPALPLELQEELASTGDESTKIDLTYRSDLSETSIESMARGASDFLKRRLLTLDQVPQWLLEASSSEADPDLRRAAAASSRAPRALLLRLSADADADVRTTAQHSLIDGARYGDAQDPLTDGWTEGIVGAHPQITLGVALALSRLGGREARVRLAKNPRTPAEALVVLAKDADVYVRITVLDHPKLPGEGLDALLDDPVTTIRETLARRTDVGQKRLLQLAVDPAASVRETVAMRADLDEAVVALLRSSGDPAVEERLREREDRSDPEPPFTLGSLWRLLDVTTEIATGPELRASLERGLATHLESDDSPVYVFDALIDSLDQTLGRALDAILHHRAFQELEGRWRGLAFIVGTAHLGPPIKCELLNCSKDDLLADFEDAPELVKSGLHKLLYSAEYGPFGGRPYGALLVDQKFGATTGDVRVLSLIAGVAEISALLVMASAEPSLLGSADLGDLAGAGPRALAGAVGRDWEAFRASSRARHLALVVPRILARAPYSFWGQGDRLPRYHETVSCEADALWGSGGLAVMQAIERSFHFWRLPSQIVGPDDGAVDGARVLPEGSWNEGSSLSCDFSESIAEAIAEAGFVPLVRGPGGRPYISRAPTCQSTNLGLEDLSPEDAALNRGAPAVLWAARWMQLVKVIQREQVGTWKEPLDLQNEFQAFLDRYTQLEPSTAEAPLLRLRAPLRSASFRVEELPGNAGWFGAALDLQPNWRVDGRFPTLRILNRLDRE